MSPTDRGRGADGLYRGLWWALAVAARGWLRLEVIGREKVPAQGGFVLAPAGHRSILDTPLISQTTPRVLRYMGAEKYFEIPVVGRFLRIVGGFPIERAKADRHALRLAEAMLLGGEPLIVFPEGTRFKGPLVAPIKEGAAFLACRAGVPIVPVGMGGTERALPKGARFVRPRKCVLVIGDPILPPERTEGERVRRATVRELTAELHGTLQTLFDEAQIRAGA